MQHPIENRQKFADIINEHKYEKVAEIGVRRGWFSDWLIRNTQATVYSIDSWIDNPENSHTDITVHETINRLYPHKERSIIIKAYSEQIVQDFKDETFGLIYIDAYHKMASRDIRDWWPKLIKGGCMSGHDYSEGIWPDVYRGVNQFVKENGLTLYVTGLGDNYGDEGGEQGQVSWYFFKQ